MNNVFKSMLIIGSLTMTSSVLALQIGSLTIAETATSTATPSDTDSDTFMDFVTFGCEAGSTTCTSTSEGLVDQTFGSFSPLLGEFVDFKNFSFDPLTNPTTLWTIEDTDTNNVWTLDMTSIIITSQTLLDVDLKGNATITIKDEFGTLLDTGYGVWTFQISSALGNIFSFDSTAGVPEPALTLLLATGLIGFGFARKARKAT